MTNRRDNLIFQDLLFPERVGQGEYRFYQSFHGPCPRLVYKQVTLLLILTYLPTYLICVVSQGPLITDFRQ